MITLKIKGGKLQLNEVEYSTQQYSEVVNAMAIFAVHGMKSIEVVETPHARIVVEGTAVKTHSGWGYQTSQIIEWEEDGIAKKAPLKKSELDNYGRLIQFNMPNDVYEEAQQSMRMAWVHERFRRVIGGWLYKSIGAGWAEAMGHPPKEYSFPV